MNAAVDRIVIRGARVHNLQSVDVDIPLGRLVVISGVSGSGKSSLARDTIFAEGQRRYLVCLAGRSRLLLSEVQRPDVDQIDGLPPTLSIDQQASTAHVRSTLATTTEIYDFLRLLYARAGQAHCPQCGRPISQQTSTAIVDAVLQLGEGRRVLVLAPLLRARRGQHREVFERIVREGYVRARVDGEVLDVTTPPELAASREHTVEAVVDRLVLKPGIRQRLAESVQAALRLADGQCLVCYQSDAGWQDVLFSDRNACRDCGLSFPNLEPRTFSFNSPYGACPRCRGLGAVPVGELRRTRRRRRERDADAPLTDLPAGVSLQRCEECQGSRLGPFPRAVTFLGKAIHELTALSVEAALEFFDRALQEAERAKNRTGPVPLLEQSGNGTLSVHAALVASKVLPEITSRLRFLCEVGLGYVSLDRPTRSLSGGEYQRARLAACLGAGVAGVCYILDEPTVGLHARDTDRLVRSLRRLCQGGSSVLVVEHEPAVLRQADWLVDLGPGAGQDGGRVVAAGPPSQVAQCRQSVTARFLRDEAGAAARPAGRKRRAVRSAPRLELRNARLHNLQNVCVELPLHCLVAVTGVSGSGKTSLVTETLVPVLQQALGRRSAGGGALRRASERPPSVFVVPEEAGELAGVELRGFEHVGRVVQVDRSPIGKTPRSTPATYCGVWDHIRRIFARTREARIRGYTASRFSFNATAGRCPHCAGQGVRKLEMPPLAELLVECSECGGRRFNRATLTVRYRGKSIADVLDMRFDEAVAFFDQFPRLRAQLQTFVDIGLGYLKLGQPSTSLSGGEAQRVKLAAELGQPSTAPTLFVLDEPTTGLHPADVERLVQLLHRLVEQGHSVVVIEHNLDLVAAADWVVDLGPEGGERGGQVVASGTPRQVARRKSSYTGQYLARLLTGKG